MGKERKKNVKKSPEKEILYLLERAGKKGMTTGELFAKCKTFAVSQEPYRTALKQGKADGLIDEKKGRLYLARVRGLYPAVIRRLHKTYGFAERLEQKDEIFVLGSRLKGALPGDRVLIRLSSQQRGNLPEGEVISLLEAGHPEFTGKVHLTRRGAFVTPDELGNCDFRLDGSLKGLADGDKVLAKVTRRGSERHHLRARVIRSFGTAARAHACCQAILDINGVTDRFPDPVLQEAEALSERGISPGEMLYRADFRDQVIFTIDGADSKDLDDAVSLLPMENGYLLGVHIADVSHYVREKTALDQEALRRGTSIYYADQVIPMLPKALSNGICSLNPQEDRLAFSALLTLSAQGELLDYDFQKSVICSRVKGVYTEVNALLEGTAGKEIQEKYQEVAPALRQMQKLAEILQNNRKKRGAPDIDTSESKLILDETGAIVDVQPRTRGVAERMIEEFMLVANEAAATLAKRLQLPFVYRIHESPEADKLTTLREVLQSLGLPAGAVREKAPPSVLSDVLTAAKGKPVYPIVSRQVLRSMAKARYSDVPAGHYGLALENYAHFTSPIRRYPDLAIHRILTDALAHPSALPHVRKRYARFVGKAANASTEAENVAVRIERSCEDCYHAEYMTARLGEHFDGMITSVTAFGFYVELPNTVEGLVRIETLPNGQYLFDGFLKLNELSGGRSYQVGDPVRVICVGADVNEGKVDFVLEEVGFAENVR